MIHNKKKLSKIVEELTVFFFGIGGTNMSSNIKYTPEEAFITFESDFSKEHLHKVESMGRLLNQQYDEGVEDTYWELMGSGDPGESSQLLLVGMMVDTAEVDIKDDYVKVKMYKKLP